MKGGNGKTHDAFLLAKDVIDSRKIQEGGALGSLL